MVTYYNNHQFLAFSEPMIDTFHYENRGFGRQAYLFGILLTEGDTAPRFGMLD